jgi:hypothetical protein
MLKIVTLMIACAVVVGCAKQPQLTLDQWREVTTRKYEGVTRDQVLEAAEKVFELASPNYECVPTKDGLIAQRNWSTYLIISAAYGHFRWNIETEEETPGVITVTAHCDGSAGSYAYASSMGPQQLIVKETGVYQLFWARMDYVLGRRTHWVTRKGFHQWKKKDPMVFGQAEPLLFMAMDADPSAPRKIPRQIGSTR